MTTTLSRSHGETGPRRPRPTSQPAAKTADRAAARPRARADSASGRLALAPAGTARATRHARIGSPTSSVPSSSPSATRQSQSSVTRRHPQPRGSAARQLSGLGLLLAEARLRFRKEATRWPSIAFRTRAYLAARRFGHEAAPVPSLVPSAQPASPAAAVNSPLS